MGRKVGIFENILAKSDLSECDVTKKGKRFLLMRISSTCKEPLFSRSSNGFIAKTCFEDYEEKGTTP